MCNAFGVHELIATQQVSKVLAMAGSNVQLKNSATFSTTSTTTRHTTTQHITNTNRLTTTSHVHHHIHTPHKRFQSTTASSAGTTEQQGGNVQAEDPQKQLNRLIGQRDKILGEIDELTAEFDAVKDELFMVETTFSEKRKEVERNAYIEGEMKELRVELQENLNLISGDDKRAEREASRRIGERLAQKLWHGHEMDQLSLQAIIFSIKKHPSFTHAALWDKVMASARWSMIRYVWMTKKIPGKEYEVDLSAKDKWLGELQPKFDETKASIEKKVKSLKHMITEREKMFKEHKEAKKALKESEENSLSQARERARFIERKVESVARLLPRAEENVETHAELYDLQLPSQREKGGGDSDENGGEEQAEDLGEWK